VFTLPIAIAGEAKSLMVPNGSIAMFIMHLPKVK
jgi:hypothetical protein